MRIAATDRSLDAEKQILPSLELSFFRLDVQDGQLPSLEGSETASIVSTANDNAVSQGTGEPDENFTDIWNIVSTDFDVVRKPKLTSWDTFLNSTVETARSQYLSEQPASHIRAVFNQVCEPKIQPPALLEKSFLISALSQLGLGRTSSLFSFDLRTGKIKCHVEHLSQQDLTSGLVNQIINDFQFWGHQWWKLNSWQKQERALSRTPILSAFASALSLVLYGLEERLLNCFYRSHSALQLHQHYQKSASLLDCLTRVLPQRKTANEDEALLLSLAEEVGSSKAGDRSTTRVTTEILQMCTRPLLLRLAEDIGLTDPTIASGKQLDLPVYRSIFGPDLSDMIQTCRESLSVLRDHQPDHPLLSPFSNGLISSSLSWETTWEGIESQRQRAQKYERRVQDRFKNRYQGGREDARISSQVKEQIEDVLGAPQPEENILPSLDWGAQKFAPIGTTQSPTTQKLFALVSRESSADEENKEDRGLFEPPIFIALASSVYPILSVQSNAVNNACFHLIFKKFNLRTHIHLQYRHQFLMDPELRSRISEALFDTSRKYSIALPNKELLPTEFSFGIEDIQDTELSTGSVQIIDLLRLHYQPPSALRYIFTERSLQLYNLIFKDMLRLLRLQHLSQTLLRQTSHKSAKHKWPANQQRFRIEAHRFTCTFSDYAANFAIGKPFQELEKFLYETEVSMEKRSMKGSKIQDIQRLHESTLERILDNLFLGNDSQQRHLQKALTTIYQTILTGNPEYSLWKQQVVKLLRLLRAQDSMNSRYLALKLDMNGYYG